MSEPAILVSHLTQGYGAEPVVHDVSFEVQPGEIFGFIGPNGAGKTTTIRTLATLLPPRSGAVRIAGIDVAADPEAACRKLGYMPDHAGIYERLSVLEYLDFFAAAAGVQRANVARAALALVGLEPFADKLVATLSKGMRQRLQLARVLLHDPEVLILDEPASDLDPRARIEMRDLLLELRELGKTIFLSSHILSELSDVCTSVGIIERGRLLVCGPIGMLSGNPALATLPSAPIAAPMTWGAALVLDPATAPEHSDVQPALELTPGGVAIPPETQRRLELRVLGEARLVRPLLEACPPIKGIDSDHGDLLVARYVGDDRFVAELVRYLVSHGVLVIGVRAERNTLERVFLQVTKGELA